MVEPEAMLQEGDWAMTRLGLVICSQQLERRIFVGALSSHVSYWLNHNPRIFESLA